MGTDGLVLVVTGAAATGKSTVGRHLRSRPGLLVIDGDVLGRGAAAVAGGRRDYVAFWRYVLAVCAEVRGIGPTPVIPCICLPDQVLAAAGDEVIHFLALVSDGPTIRRRIADRVGVSEVPSPESHVGFDASLRAARVPPPHTLVHHDVVVHDETATLAAARGWVARFAPAETSS